MLIATAYYFPFELSVMVKTHPLSISDPEQLECKREKRMDWHALLDEPSSRKLLRPHGPCSDPGVKATVCERMCNCR